MLERFFPAHTAIRSSIDVLAYRRGKIEAVIDLHPDHQLEFEREIEALKLQLDATINTAHETYRRKVRALFVQFGRIEIEPPVELTKVVGRHDDPVIDSVMSRA